MRFKIRRGQALRSPAGLVVFAISNENVRGEVLIRSPMNLRRCAYVPAAEFKLVKTGRF
jgi:hypothetical protein